MNKMNLTVLSLCCSLIFGACEKNLENGSEKEQEGNNVQISIVDKEATEETKALLSNLWIIQKKGFMFGHHDDLLYGRKWQNVQGRSDTKDVCGDYPSVFSMDFAEIMDDRSQGENNGENMKRTIIEAYSRGEVIMGCAHLYNPVTGKDFYDLSGQPINKILSEGSDTNIKYKTWLDRLADFVLSLKDNKGRPIPIIFRPFHEHNGDWFWWGNSNCTDQEFIKLWRFTVEYLRDTKNVHQFLYAFSPDAPVQRSEEEYLYRYPGDNYVDFLGADIYNGTNTITMSRNMQLLTSLSSKMKKPCGITETGIEGIQLNGSAVTDYWTKQILSPYKTGITVSMIIMWRNKYDPEEKETHYYSVFKGEASSEDFIIMYNDNLSIFSKDLPDMYTIAESIVVN